MFRARIRRGAAVCAAALLLITGVALAASAKISVTVSPNTPKAKSTLKVSAKGPFGQTGLPESLELTAQKGFQSSAKSVTQLCDTSDVPPSGPSGCPAASQIGTGKAIATFESEKETLTLTEYLGKPKKKSDIAAIVLTGSNSLIGTENVVGRLFKTKSGAIEILFSQLIGSGLPATLKSLTFDAHAVNGKNSLITNPPSCKGGHWSGTFKLKFSSGTISKTTGMPCKK